MPLRRWSFSPTTTSRLSRRGSEPRAEHRPCATLSMPSPSSATGASSRKADFGGGRRVPDLGTASGARRSESEPHPDPDLSVVEFPLHREEPLLEVLE